MDHRSKRQIRRIACIFLTALLTIGYMPNPAFSADEDVENETVDTGDKVDGDDAGEGTGGDETDDAGGNSQLAYAYLDNTGALCQRDENVTVIDDKSCITILGDNSTLSNGWYIVTGTVTVSSRVIIQGEVNLILADGCQFNAEGGISVFTDNTLRIYAQSEGDSAGALVAGSSNMPVGAVGADSEGSKSAGAGSVPSGSAGIGGIGKKESGKDSQELADCGTVEICGGNITAYGGYDAAGIGGGHEGSGGHITIYNGTVNAMGGYGGAGIGSGANYHHDAAAPNEFCVNISGGTVNAVGGYGGAGIGGGLYSCSKGFRIIITGGDVCAEGYYGAGIGSGAYIEYNTDVSKDDCGSGTVTINGGLVKAYGGNESAGIGGGSGAQNGAYVTINGGTIYVLAGNHDDSCTKEHKIDGIGAGGYPLKLVGDEFKVTGSGIDTINPGSIDVGENATVTIVTDATNSGAQYTVYGNTEFSTNLEICGKDSLTIQPGGSLTVSEGKTLTISEEGSITNNGTILVDGTFVNKSENPVGTVKYRVHVTGGTADAEYAEANTTVTLTPDEAIPEGMTAIWTMGDASVAGGSFVMPEGVVTVLYAGYKAASLGNPGAVPSETAQSPETDSRTQTPESAENPSTAENEAQVGTAADAPSGDSASASSGDIASVPSKDIAGAAPGDSADAPLQENAAASTENADTEQTGAASDAQEADTADSTAAGASGQSSGVTEERAEEDEKAVGTGAAVPSGDESGSQESEDMPDGKTDGLQSAEPQETVADEPPIQGELVEAVTDTASFGMWLLILLLIVFLIALGAKLFSGIYGRTRASSTR